jgi:PBP1b-binding outer membrane lipoprotein LpoB
MKKTNAIIFLIIQLTFFLSCGTTKTQDNSTENVTNTENMEDLETILFEMIKNAGSDGISDEKIIDSLEFPSREIEITLKKMYDDGKTDKLKADCYDKIKGRYGVLIYSVPNQ